MNLKKQLTKMLFMTAMVVVLVLLSFMIPNARLSALAEGENYLTFTAQEDNSSVTVNYYAGTDVKYQKNNGEWLDCPTGTVITLNKDELVRLKGKDFSNYQDASNITWFVMTGKIAASGDITSLLNEVGGDVSLADKPHIFHGLFYGCESLVSAPNLPSTTLSVECYHDMFFNCKGLVTGPSTLPATTLENSCYRGMFYGCIALTSTPTMAPTVVADSCCYDMFKGCKAIVENNVSLPSMTTANSCYRGMFQDCQKITQAPELPATTISQYCYRDMFYNCFAIETAPNLMATSLAKGCYQGMFQGCKTLKKVQETLPALTLAQDCYYGMYGWCYSLETSPTLPATTLAQSCYQDMFKYSGLKTPPVLSATNLETYCYAGMFQSSNNLDIPENYTLPAETLAFGSYISMFLNCQGIKHAPIINATTLAKDCCKDMFNGCTSLINAPELKATIMAENCYYAMFKFCSALVYLPPFSIENTATNCCLYMFEGCTSLDLTVGEGDVAVFVGTTENYNYTNLSGMFKNTKNEINPLGENPSTGTPSSNCTIYWNKSTANVTTAPISTSPVYSGKAQDLLKNGATLSGKLQYALGNNATTAPTEGWTETIPTATNAGQYYVWYFVDGGIYCNNSTPACVTVSFGGKEITIDWCTTSYTYNGKVQTITASYKDINDQKVDLTVSVTDFKNAGKYTATASFKNNETNYCLPSTATKEYSISKAQASITLDQTPIVVTFGDTVTLTQGTTNFGEIQTNIKASDIVNAGEYTITYSVTVTDNYDGDSKTLKVTVNKKEITIDWCTDSFTYTGNVQTITASYKDINNKKVDLTVSVTDFKNVGKYTATASFKNNETNYSLPNTTTKEYTINKASNSVATKPTAKTLTYNNTALELISAGVPAFGTMSYVVGDNATTAPVLGWETNLPKKTTAGTYYVWYKANGDANHLDTEAACLTVVLNKGKASITLDQTPIVVTYGDKVTLTQGTTNFGTIETDIKAAEIINAGEYTITYSVPATNNFDGDSKTLKVTVNKKKVAEPIVNGTYKYTGNQQEVVIYGEESYMTTTDAKKQTNVGVYTISYTLDNNHEWVDGADGQITWEIKSTNIQSQTQDGQKPKVIIEGFEGFTSDVSVVAEVKTEKNIDQNFYANLANENLKLNKKETVKFVFDVKLIQNDVTIQPDGTIKVKVLIPENIDVTTIKRIVHVHSETDVEGIAFDASKMDENRYYEITVNKLSEFAFVGEKETTEVIPLIIGGVVGIVVVVLCFTLFSKKKGKSVKSDGLN